MAEAERIVFNRGVNFVLPAAIPTHLDRSEEYALGDVLVFEKKLRPLMPWRKHRLVFTGVNISELLKDQAEPLNIKESTESIFDNANTSRTFGVDAKVDAEIQYAVAHFGVDVQATENASMSVDFGKVDRHFTNLSNVLAQQSGKMSVSLTHPVIQDALKNNSTLFVITSMYVAEKAIVNLSYTSGGKDDTKDNIKQKSEATNPPPSTSGQAVAGQVPPTQPPTTTPSTTPPVATPEGPGADIDVSFTSNGKSVVERNKPTNMAYRVIRIKLGRHGVLIPQLRAAVRHVKVKVMDETDFGGSNFVDAKQSSDDCDYTHDRFDVMAAGEDDS